MKIKGNPIKTKVVFILFILLIVAPACELFLPLPENEELKLEALLLNSPINGSTILIESYSQIELAWADIDQDKHYQVDYELYISENPIPGLYISNLENNTFRIELDRNKRYYWKVVAKLDDKVVESEVWSFMTE